MNEQVGTVARLTSGAVEFQMVLPDAGTDYIQSTLASGSLYEAELLEDIVQRLADGSLVLDIGANIGSHTCYLAAAGMSVVAFEPDAHLVAALRRSVVLNRFDDRVDVRHLAVGAEAARGVLVTPDPRNLGTQRVRIAHGASPEGAQTTDVPVRTIDQQAYPDRVAAMKIDVEGMELQVLAGSTALIARDQPLVYVEALTGAQFVDCYELLGRLGYRYRATFNYSPTHLFEPGHAPLPLDRLDATGRLASRMYRAEEAQRTSKRQLEGANAKYRTVTALLAAERAASGADGGRAARLQEDRLIVRAWIRAAQERERALEAEIERARADREDADRATTARAETLTSLVTSLSAQLADLAQRLADMDAKLRAQDRLLAQQPGTAEQPDDTHGSEQR